MRHGGGRGGIFPRRCFPCKEEVEGVLGSEAVVEAERQKTVGLVEGVLNRVDHSNVAEDMEVAVAMT